jgi:hypothetical protein
MKKILFTVIYLACIGHALGETVYHPIREGLEISKASSPVSCSIGSIRISVKNQHISIETKNNTMHAPIDELPGSAELIIGDMTGDDFCDLAIPYGKSDVNESYKIFLYDRAHSTLVESKAGIITNPEFKTQKIVSSYRDAARWHKETLCISEILHDFYICEKRTNIDSHIESLTICNEQQCTTPMIVHKLSSTQASAIVSVDKARLYEKLDDRSLKARKGYLINGDKVDLVDFFQSHDDFFYAISYVKGKSTTTGWIRATQLTLLPEKTNQ